MTLICYSEVIHKLGSLNAAKVRAALEGYQRLTFTQPLLDLMQLLYSFSALMSDLSVSVLEYYFHPVFAFGGDSDKTYIPIRLVKSQPISIKLDDLCLFYIQQHALRRGCSFFYNYFPVTQPIAPIDQGISKVVQSFVFEVQILMPFLLPRTDSFSM